MALAAIVALAALATLTSPALQVHRNVACAVAGRVVGDIAARHAGVATAQEVLEFKPVPPESAAQLERERAQRRATRTTVKTPAVPAVPPVPSVPAVPPVPPVPALVGKSGDMMRVGSDITVEKDQRVIGNVMAVGGDVKVKGHVEGDVVSMGGDVFLEAGARVDGDVVTMGGELHEEEGVIVGGKRVSAAGGREWARDRGDIDIHLDGDRGGRRHFPDFSGAFVWLGLTLLVAWAFAGLAPGRTRASVDTLQREPGLSGGVGFLGMLITVPGFIAVVLFAALLAITIIGIPLAIVALLGYPAVLALVYVWGYVVGCAAIGENLLKRREPSPGLVKSALTGTAVIAGIGILGKLLKIVPGLGGLGGLLQGLGWLAFALVVLIGSGAWLRYELQQGTLVRWWQGRRGGGTPPPPPPGGWEPTPAGPAPPPASGGAAQWYPGGSAGPAGTAPAQGWGPPPAGTAPPQSWTPPPQGPGAPPQSAGWSGPPPQSPGAPPQSPGWSGGTPPAPGGPEHPAGS
jgi:hypothetical protein